MAKAIQLATHPDFTVDELIQLSGWPVPSPAYRDNLGRALTYFQNVVPRAVLRQRDDAGPWNLRINGTKIRLLNWMQGIDFHQPVNPNRTVSKGDPLIAFKDPSMALGPVRGNWYTFPSGQHEAVAIHSTQTRMHKFKAQSTFTCLQSRASDAFVGWVSGMPAEYRRGGAHQLFIANAARVLAPM